MEFTADIPNIQVQTDSFYHSTPTPESIVIDDFEAVISRARAAGVGSMIITGTSLRESKKALEISKKYSGQILLWIGGYSPHTSRPIYHCGMSSY